MSAEAKEKKEVWWNGGGAMAFHLISPLSALPALIDRHRENVKEGSLKHTEINNDNEHTTICLQRWKSLIDWINLWKESWWAKMQHFSPSDLKERNFIHLRLNKWMIFRWNVFWKLSTGRKREKSSEPNTSHTVFESNGVCMVFSFLLMLHWPPRKPPAQRTSAVNMIYSHVDSTNTEEKIYSDITLSR